MKKVISFVMILAIVAATAVAPSVPASAERTDIWQVNGKYTLTKKKLVTYCALNSADSGMKEKKACSRWENVKRKYYCTQNGGF